MNDNLTGEPAAFRCPIRPSRGARTIPWAASLLAALWAGGCRAPSGSGSWECIAPAAAGGGWDLTCRTLSQVLAELDLSPGYMQTTNKPGAGGGVAYAHVVGRRASDPGLLAAASPATLLRLAQRQYADFTTSDVRWVAAVGAEYGVVAVAQDAPWSTLGDLMTAWQADPESIVVSGGSTVAGQDHAKILLLAAEGGIDPARVRYVPFDGGGEAMTALLGGFVQVFSGEGSEVEGQVEAGRLRVLAVLSPSRLGGSLSAAPTALEEGYDVEWATWRGFYAPASLPPGRYEDWVTLLSEVVASPAWEDALRVNHLQPFFLAGPEFEAFVRDQTEDFARISREIGLIR